MCGGGIQSGTTCGRPYAFGIREDSSCAVRPVSGALAVAAMSRPVDGPAKAGEKVIGRVLRRFVRCYSSSRPPGLSTKAECDLRASRMARVPAASVRVRETVCKSSVLGARRRRFRGYSRFGARGQ